MRAPRPRSPYGTVIWSTAIGAGLTLLAWLAGWWPVAVDDPATGRLVDDRAENTAPAEEPLGPPPEQWEPEIVDVVAANEEADDDGADDDDWPESVEEPERPPRRLRPELSDAARTIEFEPQEERIPERVPVEFTRIEPTEPPPRVRPAAAVEPPPFDVVQAGGSDTDDRTVAKPVDEAPRAASLDLTAIDELIRGGRIAEAHRELSKIWWSHPGARSTIRQRIETTARKIFFDPAPHFMEPYEIQPGDRLSKIGARYEVPWQYLVRLNGVDPRRIRSGDRLKVVRGPFHARIDLSEFTLTVHNHGYFVKEYRVGIGADGRTPRGTFTVKNKVVDPQYTDPEGRVIASDDPANPIGERWIDIGGGFGIHGTIEPKSIGEAKSAGCIRLLNEDVAEVYDLLGLGSEVVIHD